jgi:hypothetical protein
VRTAVHQRVGLNGSMPKVTRLVLMLLVLSLNGFGLLAAQAPPNVVDDTVTLLNDDPTSAWDYTCGDKELVADVMSRMSSSLC